MTTLHIAAVCLTDIQGRLLVVRKHHARFWMLPGGKAEAGEAPFATMQREALEEIGIHLTEDMVTYLGHYTAAAANEPGYSVSAHIFYGNYDGALAPLAELAEIAWMLPEALPADTTAPLLKEAVLPALKRIQTGTAAKTMP